MFNYALEFSNYLIDITCVATGVTRQELGLEPANSEGLGGSGLHDAMESVHNRRLVRLANFLADVIFTPILQEEFGLQNFVWSWPALEAQDPRAHAELNQILLFSAQKSLDEILMEQGQEPVGIGRFLNLGGKLLFEKDMLNMQSEGTLALEQQQAKQQLDDQTEQTKEIAEHQTEQTKEIAEHAAGLQQNQAEQQAQLGQQAAEQGAGLQSQQNEQQAQLQQANAEQQVQVQGDMDMQQADHQAQLTQQQLVQQQQFQAQQSRLQHQYTMTQQQQAAEYAHHQALTNYHLRMGLPPPATPVADPNGAGAMPQPATPDANPATKFLLERAQAADFDRQNQQLQNDMALATIPEMEPGNPDESPDWDMDGAQQDVSQWGRKLEKAAKAGKDLARVKFVPNFLTSEQTDLIQGTINKMATPTPTEIRQTFRHIQEVFSSGTDDQEPG
jgi:DNA polymerase III alpha subunit (gram-positive type)